MPIRVLHLALLALAAPTSAMTQMLPDSGKYFVRHGRDTVATEHFVRTATRLEGTLAIHNKKRTSQRWTAVVGPDGTLPLVDVTVWEGVDGPGKMRVIQRARVIFKEDSAAVDVFAGDGLQTRLFATERGAVPYLNLSFALMEQAVRRARGAPEQAEVAFFNLGGGQTVVAKLSPLGTDSLLLDIGKVRYHLRVDSLGRVLGGRIPSQDVVVDRR